MRHATLLPAVPAPGGLSLDLSRTAAPVAHARLVWLAGISLRSSSPGAAAAPCHPTSCQGS